ncbi:MAG: hydroxymethylglutaryl-CoA reductase [Fluviicola sp.]|nr:hydroxymethylglutaryl-CoA reductase [Fluviicola sp.]
MSKRQAHIKQQTGFDFPYLFGEERITDTEIFKGNIEQQIGFTQVPTGIIGPLLVKGTIAQGNFFVPLATTEGTLVASYNRGAKATALCGGIVSVCLTEGVQRAPLFKFRTLQEVGKFMQWILEQIHNFKKIVSEHSNHAQLDDIKINMEGNNVVLVFEYQTGEAAGQNMTTICTDAICQYIIEHTPIQPQHWFIESNYAGDKKATVTSFSSVRGKKVTAEAVITRQVVKEILGTTPEKIVHYWQSSSVAAIQSGSIGIQGHFANGLTALFLATGQDAACVSEAHIGITRMEINEENNLYVSVTLPALVVGTVGGGTKLPTQKECLKLLGCEGEGSARKFAEICGATILAGELSIAAAIACGSFSKAHKLLGRKK